MSAMNIAYKYQNSLYVNLTNRCTNKCKFCIRYTKTGNKLYRDTDLFPFSICMLSKRYTSVVIEVISSYLFPDFVALSQQFLRYRSRFIYNIQILHDMVVLAGT